MGDEAGFARGWKAFERYLEESENEPPVPQATDPEGWEYVGYAAVDSGTLIIIDPGYLNHNGPPNLFDDLVGPYNTPEDWQPKQRVLEDTGPGAAFVRLSQFGGDINPSIYVKRHQGIVVAAMLVFDDRTITPVVNK